MQPAIVFTDPEGVRVQLRAIEGKTFIAHQLICDGEGVAEREVVFEPKSGRGRWRRMRYTEGDPGSAVRTTWVEPAEGAALVQYLHVLVDNYATQPAAG